MHRRRIIRRRRKPLKRQAATVSRSASGVSDQLKNIMSFIDQNLKDIDANITNTLKGTYQLIDDEVANVTTNGSEEEQDKTDSQCAQPSAVEDHDTQPSESLAEHYLPPDILANLQAVQQNINATAISLQQSINNQNQLYGNLMNADGSAAQIAEQEP